MKKLLCAATAIAGFATVAWGGYVSGVHVNGVDVGQTSSGDGWNFDDSHRINLKGSGKTYVITGADTGKRDIRVKIETDCTVVISNLTLAVEKSHCNALWLDASKSSLTGTVLFYGVNDLSSGGGAAGIGVKKGQTLNLLGMQATAELHATGGKSGAGIGGDDGVESESYSNCGTVGIFGGKVYATGGRGAAGIGGGGGNIWALGDDAPSVGHGGEVSIFQTSAPVCEVYATGGGAGEMSKQGGAGIGGGSSLRNCNNGNDGQGGSLTVYGGKVVARGGFNAVGIGGAAAANYGGAMSKVEISGGTVEAYGNGMAAGIGGAANSKTGILFHYVQSGGRVKAVGGSTKVPAIGGNDETGCGIMEISGGTVEAASVGDAGPKHFFLVMISGGSVVLTSPNAFGALYAGYADNVEDAVAVFPVRRTGYTSGAAVSISDFKGGTYGVKDIFAVGTSGEVCLWLPRGDYSFAINGATYMPSVDAEGGVTWRTPAKTAKAVVQDGNKTLRFVYDATNYGTKGTDWFSVAEAEAIDPQTDDVPWASYGGRVTKVVFDPSFADYRPTQCGSWFYGFSSLATIEGIENLNTSEATNFAYMFDYCLTLTALDLSGFDTAKATDMHFMFADSKNLKTISVSDRFVTTKVADSSNMFRGCTALVGGAGTAYDSAKIDKTYARIDKTGQPGYFTEVPRSAKVVVEDGGKTLRFVYDAVDYGTKDTDWFSVAEAEAIDPRSDLVPWCHKKSTVTKVVFDPSFAAYRPKQCGCWFEDFGVLVAVDGLTNLNTSVATNMARMFFGCKALKSLDVSGFNTAMVTDMRSMFNSCLSLTTLDVSGFDTANVTVMYCMFDGCSSLTTLDVSGFDTAKVTDMSYMFSGCTALKMIIASSTFVTSAMTSSGSMFNGCTVLVGGAGTAYDSTKTDKTYARIDGGPSAPGYFTEESLPEGSYGIRFAANGGTGAMADQVCEKGKVYNLTKCAFTPPGGKTFEGWVCQETGKRYDDGVLVFDLAASGKTVTMTAVWK